MATLLVIIDNIFNFYADSVTVAHWSLKRKLWIQQYKNNFSQLEPTNGNVSSAEDDIGESLTANAEGIE